MLCVTTARKTINASMTFMFGWGFHAQCESHGAGRVRRSGLPKRCEPEILSVHSPVPSDQGVLISGKVIEDLLTYRRMRLDRHKAWLEPADREACQCLRFRQLDVH